MRIFFLLLFFFMVRAGFGEEADDTECELEQTSVIKNGIHRTYVNEAFIANMSNCTEWIGHLPKYDDFLYIEKDVTQEMFNQMFRKVKKLSKLSWIYIQDNKNLTSLVFPSLKSVDSALMFITLKDCSHVKTISFPVLDESHDLYTLIVSGMASLDVISIDHLMKKFVGKETVLEGDLCDGKKVADPSQSKCKFVTTTQTTNGIRKSTITYVKDELKIVGAQVRNLDFLKLEPLAEKNKKKCEIRNNTFCTFDKASVVKMLEGVYQKCTIENNLDGECDCNFPNKEYIVDQNFVANYWDCLEWIGAGGGTRIVMDHTVTQGMFDTILLNVTRITGVSLEINKNEKLGNLNFSKLETFGEEGENISAVFTSNPNVTDISFPQLSKSSVQVVTRNMHSLSKESIEHLNKMFPKGEIVHYRECNFPNKEYIVDADFVEHHSDCLEWIGADGGTRIVMDHTVTQGMFDTILLNVTRITGVSLEINKNKNLRNLNFSKLETFGEQGENIRAVFTSNPNVTDISFPRLSKSSVQVLTRNMHKLSRESIEHLNKKFPEGKIAYYRECDINPPISDISNLSNCSGVSSLQFVPNIRGNVTSLIEFVRGPLEIEGTLLENLDFLKLTSQKKQNANQCRVANNKFCGYYNETAIAENLGKVYPDCVFENNIGGYCVCDLPEAQYIVDGGFLAKFSDCSEWNSTNRNGASKVVMKGNVSQDVFVQVFGKLTKISGVSFEISENHVLTSLEFPKLEKLESFGKEGQDISAEFKFNSKVQSISFPNISESSAKIVTKGMHSMSNESINTLNGKFNSDGIAQFGVCHLRESQTFLMDRDFVRDYWQCTEWISKKSTIVLDPDTSVMRFRRAFSKVKKISGASIEIHQNVHFDRLLFPRIESFGNPKFSLRIYHCPRLRNISFPRLLSTSSKNLKTSIYGTNEMSKRTIKRLKFAHYKDLCDFNYPISQVSILSKCRNVSSLEFTAGMVGIVKEPIVSVDQDLFIHNTRLRDLDFLKLAWRKEKNVNNCNEFGAESIIGNRLCKFDAKELTKTVLKFYKHCTIEGNLNITSCEHYPTPAPYRPRRNLQFDSRGYYIPPKGEDWWIMPASFVCSIVFRLFLCWNCN